MLQVNEHFCPLVVRSEITREERRGGHFQGEDLRKRNIWCEDTQLQDPSTVNTCVMLNRMDKWDGGWNNGIPLHPEHVLGTAWEHVSLQKDHLKLTAATHQTGFMDMTAETQECADNYAFL